MEEQMTLFNMEEMNLESASVYTNEQSFKVYLGDALERLKDIPDQSVDCCVTSPPYYALRDYGTGKWVGGDPNCPHKRASNWSDKMVTGQARPELVGMIGDGIFKKVCLLCGAVREDRQIGLEESPEEYIEALTKVFHEVKRVLKDDGTLWLNIGDSYWGSGSRGFDFTNVFTEKSEIQKGSKGTTNLSAVPTLKGNVGDYKNKDLIGIPWMLAFALRADGWYLRQDIIWAKPNPMPESTMDRCTRSHEYIFLMSKKPKYYFDHEAVQEEANTEPKARDKNAEGYQADYMNGDRFSPGMRVYGANGKRNKRDVWRISTKPCSEAHFATYPLELAETCILAGSHRGGTILDPFNGSGSTGIVAVKNGRDYVGIELNEEYVEITKRRAKKEAACAVEVL